MKTRKVVISNTVTHSQEFIYDAVAFLILFALSDVTYLHVVSPTSGLKNESVQEDVVLLTFVSHENPDGWIALVVFNVSIGELCDTTAFVSGSNDVFTTRPNASLSKIGIPDLSNNTYDLFPYSSLTDDNVSLSYVMVAVLPPVTVAPRSLL